MEEELLFKVRTMFAGINVSIGSENKRAVQGMQLITATYKVNDKTIGSVGIIAPRWNTQGHCHC